MDIDKGISDPPGGAAASPPGAGGQPGSGAAVPPGAGGEEAPARPGPGQRGSPIEFRLDATSGVPTYLQLVHQVEHALRLGYLEPGDQLPKVRDVVADLAINPNTVLKAYRDLEAKGLAAGRPGQGTFIEATLSQVSLPELTVLRRSLSGWLTAADRAGLDEDGIVALFTSELRDFYERRRDPAGRGRTAAGGTEGVA
jgi:GntR family transcriptional regulator